MVASDLDGLAAEPPTAATLLGLLGSPNARDRKPIWRRYDHMNGTNTLVGPGAGDAALLRVKGTGRALALSIDGPGPARVGALDPYLAGVSAVVEGALNVACHGATPIGITDCLNFGSPETDLGAWQLERAIDGIADACRALGVPVVSGNVSLYNETPEGPILPTPVVGTVGVLEDRGAALRMAWARGDEVWLLGEQSSDPDALAGSEHAWHRGLRGGVPTLDLAAAGRLIRLLPELARSGTVRAAHDCSVGGSRSRWRGWRWRRRWACALGWTWQTNIRPRPPSVSAAAESSSAWSRHGWRICSGSPGRREWRPRRSAWRAVMRSTFSSEAPGSPSRSRDWRRPGEPPSRWVGTGGRIAVLG